MTNVTALPRIGFWKATSRGFKGLFRFEGRTRRSEYWWYLLSVIIVFYAVYIPVFMCYTLNSSNIAHSYGKLEGTSLKVVIDSIVFFVVLALPQVLLISAQVRRLHDIGWSAFVPMVSFVATLLTMLFFAHGTAMLIRGAEINALLQNDAIASTGFIALLLFPVMQFIVFICSLIDSNKVTNKYGDSPKYIEVEN